MTSPTFKAQRALGAVTALAAALTLAACGSTDGGGASSSGLPDEITVAAITSKTGYGALYGTYYEQGVQVAIAEINDSDLLGGSQLKVSLKDTGSDPSRASTLLSEAANSDAVAAIGLSLSPEALSAAPIAQRAKLPFIADTSPADLLAIGDFIYSAAPPQVDTQMPILAEHVSSQVDNVKIIIANDNPVQVELLDTIEPLLDEAGVDVLDVMETPIAATDLSALVTKAVEGDPDGLVIFTGGPQAAAMLKAIRTAGYEGKLYGSQGFDGVLTNSGAEAEGFQYAPTWARQIDLPENKTFVDGFDGLYPGEGIFWPTIDGYNAVKFLALALEHAQSADREKVLAGLQAVAAEGFATPAGQATFVGDGQRQLSTGGVVVEMQDGEPVMVSGS